MDLDEDGNPDILSGSYSRRERPMAGLFQVLYGQGEGVFSEATVLNGSDGGPLVIPHDDENDVVRGICTRPWAVDWDSDGDLDLLVGNFEGSFFLFRGSGKGEFAPAPEQVMTKSGPLRIAGAHSDPMMVDWDGDGDFDLLSGSSQGGVQLAENLADADAEPEFESFRPLVPGGSPHEMGQLVSIEDLDGPSINTRVWSADLDNDGKLDLLVGDDVTLTSIASGLSESEYREKFEKWREEYNRLATTRVTEENRESHNDQFRELYFSKSEFMDEERTGFVWVYLQK